MRGGKVLGYGSEVIEEAFVSKEETGAKAVVQTEGMLQTIVRHQEGLSLRRRTPGGVDSKPI